MMISLCGFQDIKQGGIECKFQARIIDIEKTADKKMLVVKETPVKMANKDIYVFITDDTFIGFPNKTMQFEDLTIEMCIEIQGRKIIVKENDQEVIEVYARRIRPIME
jgi:uncharacterized protein YlzI (FlbEa/FlbD family)